MKPLKRMALKMNRLRTIIILFLMNPFILSMYSGENHRLLNDEDFALVHISNRTGPALSSILGVEPYWRSYHEWLCFSSEELDLKISEHELEELTLVPTLAIWFDGHLYEFEVSTSTIGESGMDVYHEWEMLLENEDSFCVMAAFLQNLGTQDRSLWILQTLKTAKGYWHESDLE